MRFLPHLKFYNSNSNESTGDKNLIIDKVRESFTEKASPHLHYKASVRGQQMRKRVFFERDITCDTSGGMWSLAWVSGNGTNDFKEK